MTSEISFLTGCLTKTKESSLPYYLLIAEERKDGFISFPRVLVWSETQSCSGFELCLPIPFPMMITVTLNVPHKIVAVISFYDHQMQGRAVWIVTEIVD